MHVSCARSFGSGLVICITPILVTELATQPDFAKTYGLILAGQAPFALIGVPIAGVVVNASSYLVAFLMGGGAVAASGFFYFLLHFKQQFVTWPTRPSNSPLADSLRARCLSASSRHRWCSLGCSQLSVFK